MLVPDNLLDEIGGRVFVANVFGRFFEGLIQSKEFLRDKYEEEYGEILNALHDKTM